MKQTIRLNERELHNLISESVRRSLNEGLDELDWKTYANAAKVAKEKGKKWNDENGENGRSKRFAQQARKQFAKDKGYKMMDDYPKNRYFQAKYDNTYDYGDYGYDDEPYFGIPKNGTFEPWYMDDENDRQLHVRIPHSRIDTMAGDGLGIGATEYNPNNPIHRKLQDDWDEIYKYNRGESHYTPGKGWDKNESIIRESVRKTLRKYLR